MPFVNVGLLTRIGGTGVRLGLGAGLLTQRRAGSVRPLTMHSAVHILILMAEKRKRKNPAAVALGRRGGARSRVNLTPTQRTALGRKGAAARWAKEKKGE